MEKVTHYINQNRQTYINELCEVLKIPSVSSQKEHHPDVLKTAQWFADQMKRIGLENVQTLATGKNSNGSGEGNPVIYADWLRAPGKPTILIYGHYDVQPVDPVNLWNTPPFEPTIRNNELYARGASDDKGQTFLHLKAIEAHLKIHQALPCNVKFCLEGEEEIGSEHLDDFLKTHQSLLKADQVMISDTSMFDYEVPSICYGLRGLAYLEVEVSGANTDLHSGSFGGTVGNPIHILTSMITQLHDRNEKITVPGFYKDVRPLSKQERANFKKLPFSDKKYSKMLGVKALVGEKGYSTLERMWARPTLDCNGIWGGYTGEGAKTVIPNKAYAKISMRLVPNQKPEKIAKLFEKYLYQIAPKSVTIKIKNLHGGNPAITPLDSPGVKAAFLAMEKAFGKKPVYQMEGGSIPIVLSFKEILGLETVLMGFGLPDENSHAPNEKLNLNNFHRGILSAAYFLDEFAKQFS